MVTFGDGAQSKIDRIGTIKIKGSPVLENVPLVIDLKANLISVG